MKNRFIGTKKFKHLAMVLFMAIAICASGDNKGIIKKESVSAEVTGSYDKVTDINYNETLEEVNNPERGWYHVHKLELKESANTDIRLDVPGSSFYNNIADDYSMVHLLVDLSAFSGKYNNNHDIKLTENALETLENCLIAIKASGKTAIVRFAYDKAYEGEKENYNKEPSMDMILQHIEQVGAVISAHKEVISCVECGIFGPWGEMHTSNLIPNNNIALRNQNLSLVINKWLDVLPEEITVNVRQPEFYAVWANVPIGNIDANVSSKGQRAYRIGIYNDGYLGSSDDLGTFRNRTKEVKWLSYQAKHTLYGGEVCKWDDTGAAGNTVASISLEGFKTHTTYLNWAWNDEVILGWKNQTYSGEDSLYNGVNGLKYVSNHLGYRFVLKDSQITGLVESGKNLGIKLSIMNVGFGNLVKEKKVTVVIANTTGEVREIPVNVDATAWESSSTSAVEISVPIPADLTIGQYKAYVRISQAGNMANDNNYLCIRFANKNYNAEPIYNSTYGANYVGSFSIVEQDENHEHTNHEHTNHEFTKYVSVGNGRHKLVCSVCDLSKDGYENEVCSGGNASCTSKAKCDKCGEEYGEALGHLYGTPRFEPSEDGRNCRVISVCNRSGCGYEKKDNAQVKSEVIAVATCVNKGITKYVYLCDEFSFSKEIADIDIDYNNHLGERLLINKRKSSYFEKGYTGDIICCSCEKVIEAGKEEPQKKLKKVTLLSAKKTKTGRITVRWKKQKAATGYIIQYSKDKRFKKSVKAIKVSKKLTTITTIKKLTKNKNYYVRICAYKKGKVKDKTKIVYSDWSNSKKVKL